MARRSPAHSHPKLARRVSELEAEVRVLSKSNRRLQARLGELADLRAGLDEQRELAQRVAMLGDLVAEVIGAAVHGDKTEFEAALARYARDL